MTKRKIFSIDFIQSFHDKDVFYEKITDEKNVSSKIITQIILLLIFSIIYGAIMGSYNGLFQAISSAIKMPLLFILIILICFPAFFVIQSVLGSKLTWGQMLSIILTGFVFMNCIMVSFSTIIAFFMITGGNYEFIKLLHVLVIIVAGLFGMRAIVEALKFSCEKKHIYPKTGVKVFRIWIIILAFVGAQLSWSLRPFIGAKAMEFQIVRQHGGNFYVDVFQSIGNIITDRVKSDE